MLNSLHDWNHLNEGRRLMLDAAANAPRTPAVRRPCLFQELTGPEAMPRPCPGGAAKKPADDPLSRTDEPLTHDDNRKPRD